MKTELDRFILANYNLVTYTTILFCLDGFNLPQKAEHDDDSPFRLEEHHVAGKATQLQLWPHYVSNIF